VSEETKNQEVEELKAQVAALTEKVSALSEKKTDAEAKPPVVVRSSVIRKANPVANLERHNGGQFSTTINAVTGSKDHLGHPKVGKVTQGVSRSPVKRGGVNESEKFTA
jgi:hypothetical protein